MGRCSLGRKRGGNRELVKIEEVKGPETVLADRNGT